MAKIPEKNFGRWGLPDFFSPPTNRPRQNEHSPGPDVESGPGLCSFRPASAGHAGEAAV
jgi:hypothetical protein